MPLAPQPLKRFAILEWHKKGRFYKLLGFVEATNAPHATLVAREKSAAWQRVFDEMRMAARHGWGDGSDPNHYTRIACYRP